MPDEFAADIGQRVLKTVADAGLGGEVQHDFGGEVGNQVAQQIGILERPDNGAKIRRALEDDVTGALQRHVVIFGEAVEADDRNVRRPAAGAPDEADEAGRTGDQ